MKRTLRVTGSRAVGRGLTGRSREDQADVPAEDPESTDDADSVPEASTGDAE